MQMYGLLFAIILITGSNQVFNKIFSRAYSDNLPSMFLYGAIWSGGGAAVYFITCLISGASLRFPPEVILLAVMGAAGFVFCNFCLYLAMANGPLSVCMMFVTAAVAIPCLLGPAVFGETIDVKRGIALIFLFLALFLVVYEKREADKKFSLKFLFFALLVFLLNGMTMVVQKLQPFRYPEFSAAQFSVLMFGGASALNLLMLLICRALGQKRKPITVKAFMLPCICTGVCICAANQLSMLASRHVEAAVQYPVQTGGLLVVTTLYSALVLREKTNLRKWIGLCMIVVSIIFL